MTLRLVGLMSLVLLLCLASFGLLMGHYQDQVMEEVTRTVSAVGRATLRTLEVTDLTRGETKAEEIVDSRMHALVWAFASGDAPGADPAAGEGTVRFETEPVADLGDECPVEGPAMALRFAIDVEEVHAETDPARGGVVLKIPKLTPAAGGAGREGAPPEGAAYFARREEIHLPIPVAHYAALFDAMRDRSLVLFVGVFAVGTALSAGLATHFTRPVRRLDSALRRLSDGDLDVSVPVEGRDEVGRLSRAFNEMARRLRGNRDRARALVRREKLSALGRLAAGVAHDVRNPLHSIGLTLQNLSEIARPARAEDREEFERSLAIIRGEIRRLDDLVGSFLRFARSERRERAPADLGEMLHEIARLVHKEAERRGVTVEVRVEDGVPAAVVDAEALRSAVLNLVLNSLEAMPDGGSLALALSRQAGDLVVEVADTGRGIPEEDRERVFEFAYTTREAGTGLGLAMVHHSVVEEHGGRVELDSRAGEGTRVRLALPLVREVAG
jgi:signal transduction histidine kinase